VEFDLGFAAQTCMIVMIASAAALIALEWYVARIFPPTLRLT
jgi:hypothetical protein